MKKGSDLTQESFNRLLDWLDEDREQAGRVYERIRFRLKKMFSCRGCAESDYLADETINRVSMRLSDIIGYYSGDPALYFYGVAQKVHLEYLRKRRVREPPPEWVKSDETEEEYECLDRCMNGDANASSCKFVATFTEESALVDLLKIQIETR
jgi:hypothetical protein